MIRKRAVYAVFLLLIPPPSGAQSSSVAITEVSLSRSFFSPSLGQKIGISLATAEAGSLSVVIVDRRGRPVRALVTERKVEPGTVTLDWDGRDSKGEVVSDDAYAVSATLKSDSGASRYSPLESLENRMAVRSNGYDRRTAVISYTLPKPGRVRIEARAKGVGGAGAVSRIVVRDEPRTAGAVIDVWDGFDDRHAVYLPDLPGFEVVVTATELPENAILTTGNRSASRPGLARAGPKASVGVGEVHR
jgi:hypothetical protein